MKILFFIRSLEIGGSQRQLALLAAGLARRGHDVSVALFYPGVMEEDLQRAGVRIVPLNKAGRWDVARPLARLWWLFHKEQADVVYGFLPTQTTLAALVLPPWSPSRLVFGVRSAGVDLRQYELLSGLVYRLEARWSRRADLIIANARLARSDAVARGLPADRIAVVGNGIDTETMRPDAEAGRAQRAAWGIAEREFVVGMVARLDPMKDHPGFIAAAADFARKHPDARFVCVGDGPPAYRRQLEALAQSHGLDARIVWAGEVPATRAVYNAFDVTTLSSAFGEGFPNVVGEAMACGVPVVATDLGDTAFVIGDRDAVAPPREPLLLSAAWSRMRERLAAGPAGLRDDLRARVVQQFAVETMIEKTEDILSALCAGRPVAAITARYA